MTPIPIPNKEADTIAQALSALIGDKGPMRRLHSDFGSEFCNKVIKALCTLYDIDKSTTTAYHPQGNAFAERVHQFLRNALSSLVNTLGKAWDKFLPAIQFAYNTAIHTTIGISPYYAFYGRHPGAVQPFSEQLSDNSKFYSAMDYAEKLKWALYKLHHQILEKIALMQNKKRFKDAEYSIPTYKPGDLVKMEVPRVKTGESKKLKFVWSGPWTITRQGKNPRVYYIKDELGVEIPTPVSVVRLLPFHTSIDFPILKEDDFSSVPSVTNTGDFWQTLDDDQKDSTPMVDDPKDKSYSEPFDIPLTVTKVTTLDEQVHTEIEDKEDKIPEITKVIVTGIKGFKVGHDTYQDENGDIVLKKRHVPSATKRVSRTTAKYKSYQESLKGKK